MVDQAVGLEATYTRQAGRGREIDALGKFRNSNGWMAGVDASVAVANIGANGRIDAISSQKPVVSFILTNTGLVAGVSLEGTKINKLDHKSDASPSGGFITRN